jgi:hypothetical protein
MKATRVLGVFVLVVMLAGLVMGTSCGGEGPTGVGIQSIVNNGNGTFAVNLSDGSSFTTDNLTGSQGGQGLAGVGIQSITNNGNGTLTLKLTDGSSFTTADLTGPQGAKGDQGIQGVQGPLGLGYSPMQIALLHWYEAIQTGNAFSVGTNPGGIAFDGANIWVANGNSNNVTKLKASDGSLVGTYSVGTNPRGIAFDGANIWVANWGTNNVTKLNASDGSPVDTYSV